MTGSGRHEDGIERVALLLRVSSEEQPLFGREEDG
jgi:hypothetical protein